MSIEEACEACGAVVRGDDMGAFGDAFIAHVRQAHPDWPYSDVDVRNYAEATQRLADATERVDEIGALEVHPVTEDRLEDWLAFFDRDAFAGNPAWAACYCSEPHVAKPEVPPEERESSTWQANRELMRERLRSGGTFGYLAYVEGRPAGWVNASLRACYTLYAQGTGATPPDGEVIGISCFAVAPPYRRHGVASRLLDRVLADAPGRGARWVEAYPFKDEKEGDAAHFRGPRALFESRGFVPVVERERDVIVRRGV
jgi:GNAT superfamily N-acetyltransferase